MSFFRLCCAAALIGFLALGLVHRHAAQDPDPTAATMMHLRAAGHAVSAPTKMLWGVPAMAVSMDGCSGPVTVLPFDFDEIVGPGMLRAVLVAEHDTLRISYAGQTFESLDRPALYRLRLRSDMAQLIHMRGVDEPPVLLSFWPPGCAPQAIF